MPALEKRITSLERIQGTVVPPRIVVKFVSPTRGLVGMRCGTLTMNRLEHETEVQFLVRARQELGKVCKTSAAEPRYETVKA